MRTLVGGLASMLVALAPGLAAAQTQLPDLARATLEELMNIEVTSVSRREQRAEDAAASLYVIGREEIRRSGLTSIAEVLRLAPGVQVSRINANKWSVSVRGFNTLASSKLLVMVDGRSIYNPAYSSVLWDTEDLLLEDVERIEVIRGPGGAMWGANAVNGVINIITRPSADTRGGLARVSGGTFDTSTAAFRYGGGMGAFTYRAFGQSSNHGASRAAMGGSAHDSWRSVTAGLRADWNGGPQVFMFEAGTTIGEQRPLWVDPMAEPAPGPASGDEAESSTRVSHALGRWTRTRSTGDTLQLQGYFDENRRDEFVGAYRRHTVDADAQYTTLRGSAHTLVFGGGLRSLDEQLLGRGPYAFTPDSVDSVIANAFAQDSMTVARGRAELTIGAKYEHSTVTGSAFQPNARVLWKVTPQQRAWVAIARAVRTPSLVDRGLHLQMPAMATAGDLPLFTGSMGNPDLAAEQLVNLEGGYRVTLTGRVSLDAVAFRGAYRNVILLEVPTSPVLSLVNQRPALTAYSTYENWNHLGTAGGELTARARLTAFWDADASLSLFSVGSLSPNGLAASMPVLGDDTAARQWRLHSGWSLGARRTADLRFVNVSPGGRQVPGYSRVDARVEWGLTRQLSLAANGQNLLNGSHLESGLYRVNVVATRVPRSGHLDLIWRF